MAKKYRGKGYPNAKALKGGLDGWKAAGYPVHEVQ
jgi:rhodanese-related sulfurtransferase